MNIFDVIILGVIQGITEFLPISSSGHLVLGKSLLHISTPGVSLEVWLHLGTLVAVMVYFRRRIITIIQALPGLSRPDMRQQDRTLLWALIVGTLPAVIIGLSFKRYIEEAFHSPHLVAAMLMVTGLFLIATVAAENRKKSVGIGRGLAVGIAQSIAILPGISRSGSTMSCAMFLGVDPVLAAEFSFLLAIPAIGGAFLLDTISSEESLLGSGQFPFYLIGAAVSFAFGLLSIHYLLKIIRTGRFFLFGFYCLVIGLISLIFLP